MKPEHSLLFQSMNRSLIGNQLPWLLALVSLLLFDDYLKNRRFSQLSLAHYAGAFLLVTLRYLKRKLHKS
ncbi:hypothetical protein G8759_31195 [Spirosoma aureum]|uniref:Uncharacterized protein n=1 Tax=Spirosoma aureum TaxID=2692134 RepID=A0A6G9AWK0_9BACT|nr:hypothetical protein [Spirosoma aureum]QIP16790.1 hypothetical protein G8759_31195 [Spirosoma aureum]